jgi:hypothetical protein
MIPRIYGPAHRRPGTKYIDTCNGVARVVPFIYSSTIAYILLFENQELFFYYDGGRVLDGVGQRLKVHTPYLAADLFEIQYKQSNDVMWLVHGDYEQRKLTRTTANSFDLSTITFTNGPFIKRNDLRVGDGITLTPSVTTGSGTLTASSATFDSGHVGALFAVTQPRVNTEVDGTMTNPATGVIGSAILVEGAFTFVTHGVWTGTVKLERSIDQSNWETYRTWTSENADQQVQYTGDESENDIYYRINVTAMSANTGAYSSQTSKIRATLTVNSSTQTGICRITAFSSSTSVSMTVLKDFASTNADVRWAEGCWSTYRGFPRTVTFFENRCIYAGTDFQPQTIWFSATDDYENFSECTKDDSAFSLTLSADTRNSIKWISALEALLVGTTGGEWRVRSSSFDEPLTPTNFSAKIQTTYGSAPMQAMAVNDVVLFVDFVRRKVRECTYSPNKDKFVSHDMNSLAEHITESGIVDMDFQKNPDPILWSTRDDGTLLSMTYERDQNVVGWARHPFERGDDVTVTVPAVPAVAETYKYTWFSSNGTVFGVPLLDNDCVYLDASPAVDVGGGIVGLDYNNVTASGDVRFASGDAVEITGTTNYDGGHTLTSGTTATQLQFTDTYAPETFAGDETVVLQIASLPSGFGYAAYDSSGNVYYGHTRATGGDFGTGYYHVTKIASDRTITKGVVAAGWAAVAGWTLNGIALSSDENSLYVWLEIPGPTDYGYVYKINLSTGAITWATPVADRVASPSYDMGIDANDNVYVCGTVCYRFDASTGTRSIMIGGVGAYNVHVDDTLDIILTAGAAIAPHQIHVRNRANTISDSLTVGDAAIQYGCVVTDGQFIYVLGWQSGVSRIYKISWDGTKLSHVSNAAAGDGADGTLASSLTFQRPY